MDTVAGISVGGALTGAWERIFCSHIRLRPQRDHSHVFSLELPTLFPNGYGKNTTAFSIGTPQSLRVEFVEEENGIRGFGMFGFVGILTERERLGKGVQERAEVWFDRVG